MPILGKGLKDLQQLENKLQNEIQQIDLEINRLKLTHKLIFRIENEMSLRGPISLFFIYLLAFITIFFYGKSDNIFSNITSWGLTILKVLSYFFVGFGISMICTVLLKHLIEFLLPIFLKKNTTTYFEMKRQRKTQEFQKQLKTRELAVIRYKIKNKLK